MAAQGECRIVGLGLSEEDAKYRYATAVSTTIQEIAATTAGKIFVALEALVPGEIRLGLSVDGMAVAAFNNKMEGATYLNPTPEHPQSYAVDLPMRIIGDESGTFPKPHTITVYWGKPDLRSIGWQGRADFTLLITGKSPVVKYNQKTDGD